MIPLRARYRIALLLGSLPSLSGCASIALGYGTEAAYNAAFREKIVDSSRFSADELRRLQEVQVIESAEGLQGTPKGEVVGLSCKLTAAILVFRWVWKPDLNDANGHTPEAAARMQLRVKAMLSGANAVVAPSCTHQEHVDWGNNCFETWRCTGQAYVLP